MKTTTTQLALLASTAVAASSKPQVAKSDEDCGCFLTNGTAPAYFSGRLFNDFRSLSKYAEVPDALADFKESGEASVTSEYFSSPEWENTWGIQSWTNYNEDHELPGDATVKMINSANNIYIEDNTDEDADSDTYLTMRTQRLPKFQTASEFESLEKFHYVSLRMLARTIGSPGAVSAMFTYKDGGDDPAKVQEADIEIITNNPREVISYTNQPAFDENSDVEDARATRNATVPGGKMWSDWLVHRLDWTPEKSIWYVNGEKAAEIAFQVPKDPAQIMFNLWSDGGSWSGKMDTYEEAFLQIKWIDMVYNQTESSEKRSLWLRGDKKLEEESCGVVCSIDEATEAGQAVIIAENETETKTKTSASASASATSVSKSSSAAVTKTPVTTKTPSTETPEATETQTEEDTATETESTETKPTQTGAAETDSDSDDAEPSTVPEGSSAKVMGSVVASFAALAFVLVAQF